MFEIIKLILKKNKNVFADIINDMTIKTLRDNTITFVDFKRNEICGNCKKNLSTQESTFIYNLINK